LDVAVVSRDKDVRLAAARAFDGAPATWSVRLHDQVPDKADAVVFGIDLRDEAGERLVFEPKSRSNIVERIQTSLSKGPGRVLMVTGAGRGVGVTSVALHLARASTSHYGTCFVDGNTNWSASTRLGIDGEHMTWGALKDAEHGSARNAPIALPVAGGFRSMLAPPVFERTTFDDALARARSDFERVFVDCSEPDALEAARPVADVAVLVVPPTLPGARRAAEVLARQPDVRWAVVLNRLGPGGEMTRAAVHRILGCRTTLELPCSPALRDAEDESKLLASGWSRYVRGISRLLAALETALT
jgi:hypothetical protein